MDQDADPSPSNTHTAAMHGWGCYPLPTAQAGPKSEQTIVRWGCRFGMVLLAHDPQTSGSGWVWGGGGAMMSGCEIASMILT